LALFRVEFSSDPGVKHRIRRAMYKLAVSEDIWRLIRTMHPSLKKKIKSSLKIVLSDPYAGKALLDELAGLRSFKVSSFRIMYRIKDPKQIELVTIGSRELIYKETLRIIQKEEGR
jgi:mRNA interferase RelE/StbE